MKDWPEFNHNPQDMIWLVAVRLRRRIQEPHNALHATLHFLLRYISHQLSFCLSCLPRIADAQQPTILPTHDPDALPLRSRELLCKFFYDFASHFRIFRDCVSTPQRPIYGQDFLAGCS
jgi:hypothetical protein